MAESHSEEQTYLQRDVATTLRDRFAPLGGVELEILQREPMPEPPRLD